MQRLGQMIQQLARHRRQWETNMKASNTAEAFFDSATVPSRLTEVVGFGSNPGNLRMLTYVPEAVSPSPALVVVLHGCKQTAAGYDHGSGWSALADRYGFIVLYAEQQEANNPNRCFNWFQAGDTDRDKGEAHSIRQMVEHTIEQDHVDRSRVFVTGLSAGGAMTAAMLATYPDVFAAGAIIAGLPYRCATSVPEAFECMFQGQTRSAQEWGSLVRNASSHRGPWPKVSVWHGSADTTVKPMNAGEIVKQWTDIHGLKPKPSFSETVDGYPRRVWINASGDDVIEEYVITGMAHGTPLSTGDDENSYGAAGPFLLDVGISSTYRIAEFWGLTEQAEDIARVRSTSEPVRHDPPTLFTGKRPAADEWAARSATRKPRQDAPNQSAPHMDVGAVITKALRAAGLMK
jgi:poly(hydroxyalkanoate) depolymerase family esterase